MGMPGGSVQMARRAHDANRVHMRPWMEDGRCLQPVKTERTVHGTVVTWIPGCAGLRNERHGVQKGRSRPRFSWGFLRFSPVFFCFLWVFFCFLLFSSGFLLFSLGFLLFSSGFLTVLNLNRRKLKKTIRKLKKTKENQRKLKKTKEN